MIEDLIEQKEKFIENERLDEKEKKTLTDYSNAINKFINYLKANNITNLDKNTMLDYKDYLTESNFAVKSKNKYIVILNKFLKYINKKELVLKKFKEQYKTSIDDPIWEQEHNRMLRWAKKLDLMDMYWIMRIFAHTGARISELKYFTVESLNEEYITRVFNKGKERTIIIPNELKRGLKNYCKENKIVSGFIFISPVKSGKMLNNATIWRRLKRIARAAKINPKKIHPHAWRHLFAVKCKESGIDLDELKDILGHSRIETTEIYTKTSNYGKKKKLETIKYKGGSIDV